MSGRGARFTVVVDDVEIELNCALHTPLWVLKRQLADRTGTAPEQMALVRQTAKDDSVLLQGFEDGSLRDHGIRRGSTLIMTVLDALGSRKPMAPARMPGPNDSVTDRHGRTHRGPPKIVCLDGVSERARRQTRAWLERERLNRAWERREAAMAKSIVGEPQQVATAVAPKDADHSFSGIVFDVEAKGSTEVIVDAVHVGGMLGEVSVFASRQSWAGPKLEGRYASRDPREMKGRRCSWNAKNDALTKTDWRMVYPTNTSSLLARGGRLCPSWDVPHRIELAEPVVIPPGETRGLYLHSSLPDDLGIQYRSTGNDPLPRCTHSRRVLRADGDGLVRREHAGGDGGDGPPAHNARHLAHRLRAVRHPPRLRLAPAEQGLLRRAGLPASRAGVVRGGARILPAGRADRGRHDALRTQPAGLRRVVAAEGAAALDARRRPALGGLPGGAEEEAEEEEGRAGRRGGQAGQAEVEVEIEEAQVSPRSLAQLARRGLGSEGGRCGRQACDG